MEVDRSHRSIETAGADPNRTSGRQLPVPMAKARATHVGEHAAIGQARSKTRPMQTPSLLGLMTLRTRAAVGLQAGKQMGAREASIWAGKKSGLASDQGADRGCTQHRPWGIGVSQGGREVIVENSNHPLKPPCSRFGRKRVRGRNNSARVRILTRKLSDWRKVVGKVSRVSRRVSRRDAGSSVKPHLKRALGGRGLVQSRLAFGQKGTFLIAI